MLIVQLSGTIFLPSFLLGPNIRFSVFMFSYTLDLCIFINVIDEYSKAVPLHTTKAVVWRGGT
jgi:hypothetical protein